MSDLALVDTNLLVYSFFEQSDHYIASRALIQRAEDPAAGLCLLPQNVVTRLLDLVSSRPRIGAKVHDLHLVAAMRGNGVSTIYTFNIDDFSGLDLNVLAPGT